jgi:hypothetical protein
MIWSETKMTLLLFFFSSFPYLLPPIVLLFLCTFNNLTTIHFASSSFNIYLFTNQMDKLIRVYILYFWGFSYCTYMGWAQTCDPTRNRYNQQSIEAFGRMWIGSRVNNCKKSTMNGCIRGRMRVSNIISLCNRKRLNNH